VQFHHFGLDVLALRRLVIWMSFLCLNGLSGVAQSNVTVVNPPSNPVPVNVSGTVPVSGSVDAAVTGNVGIVGTPSVSVQNPSPLPTTINGQTITPILVRDMDERARHPFAHIFSCTAVTLGLATCNDSFKVPERKELVIEYVQFYAIEDQGNTSAAYLLNTSVAGLGYTFYYPRGTATWPNVPMTHELTRIYAEPGSTVTFTGVVNVVKSHVSIPFTATVSGYLIDVP